MAANPALVVRVSANLEELKRNLADGTATINTTTAAMGKLASSFSGDRLIQNAQNVVAAVTQIGGATRLTEAEQARVNATLDRAIEKYRLLGREAPAAMVALHQATARIPPASNSIATSLAPLAGLFGVAFSSAGVLMLGRAILNDADAMVKLSEKTGIAIEPMQRLKFIAEQSGNSFEQMAAGISKMQQNLAGGDQGAVSALQSLGLSLATFKAMAPDEQFIAIATEVAKIEDPMQRVKVATELFGRAGADLLPTLIANVRELGDAAPVMSEKAEKAFDAVGDAIGRAWGQAKAFTGEGIGDVIRAFELLGKTAGELADGNLRRAWMALNDLEIEAPKVAAPLEWVAEASTKVGLSWDDAVTAGEGLTRAIEGQIANTTRLAKLQDEWAAATKRRAEEAARIEAAALLQSTKLWNEFDALRVGNSGTTTDKQIADIERWKADMIAAAIKAGTATTEFYTALEAVAAEKLTAVGSNWAALSVQSRESLQQMADQAARDYDRMLFSGLHFSREVLDAQRDKVRQLQAEARGMGESYVSAFEAARAAAAKLLQIQEDLRAEERKRQLESRKLGGAFEVTSQNFEQALRNIATSGGWNPSGMGSNIDFNRAFGYARAGYSMEEIVAIFNRERAGGSGPVPPPQGPRIPGFAGGVQGAPGGWAMVGERGPEMMHVPRGADIYPSGFDGGRAEFDRLNSIQAAMWLAAGRVITDEQRKIHELMEPLTPEGFGKIAGRIQPITQNITVNFHISQPFATPSDIWKYVEPGLLQAMRESGMR